MKNFDMWLNSFRDSISIYRLISATVGLVCAVALLASTVAMYIIAFL